MIKRFNWYETKGCIIFILNDDPWHLEYIICGRYLSPVLSSLNIFRQPFSDIKPVTYNPINEYLKDCIKYTSAYHKYLSDKINN